MSRRPRAPHYFSYALATAVVATSFACASLGSGASPSSSDSGVSEQLFKLQKDNARILDAIDELKNEASQEDSAQANCAVAVARLEEVERRIIAIEEQSLATQQRMDDAVYALQALRRSMSASYETAGQEPVLTLPPAGAEGARRNSPVTTGGIVPAGGAPEGDSSDATGFSSGVDPAASPVSASELFNAAYEDYAQNKLELALAGFEGARNADPTGPLAVKAEFWKGETLYLMGRYSDAVPVYESVVRTDADGALVPQAHLKRGFALYQARQTTEGVLELQHVIETWPESDEARLAREWLKRKGIISE